MKIKYLGPGAAVDVAPYGRHAAGEVKEYPDDFAEELLATSHRQQFEAEGAASSVGATRPVGPRPDRTGDKPADWPTAKPRKRGKE